MYWLVMNKNLILVCSHINWLILANGLQDISYSYAYANVFV
ncbi:hypothetical protein F383_25542 [Gossypium arboreum]|uniref:Uncharacterized protein n=1 Tax=Gossypium arboreum TaxID=29729 RepID=A0A0B0MR41_GOSAR|nr:hypothetical protein F383_25542 [Gossypium arboreum]